MGAKMTVSNPEGAQDASYINYKIVRLVSEKINKADYQNN